jgi:hypothetical protein
MQKALKLDLQAIHKLTKAVENQEPPQLSNQAPASMLSSSFNIW